MKIVQALGYLNRIVASAVAVAEDETLALPCIS
jgi:hypothetical protein